MQTIVDSLQLTSELLADTTICKEDNESVFQICHISPKANNLEEKEENINGIGSYLSLHKICIYGDSVVIKSKVTCDKTCIIDSICMNDIVDMIYESIIHKYVLVKQDDTIENNTFYGGPLDNIEDIDNYQCIEYSIFKFNLVLFIEVYPKVDKINEQVSALLGKKICGDVMITCKITENIYVDFDKNLYESIIKLCYSHPDTRNLKEDEIDNYVEDGNTQSLPLIKNGYCIVQQRLLDYDETKDKYWKYKKSMIQMMCSENKLIQDSDKSLYVALLAQNRSYSPKWKHNVFA